MSRYFKINGILLILWTAVLIIKGEPMRRQFIHDNEAEENDNPDTSRYKFAYGVEDHKTGDFKMHQEERDGDLVRGEYTVAEADGTLRTVKYTADKHSGFHAIISKGGHVRHEGAPSYHRSAHAHFGEAALPPPPPPASLPATPTARYYIAKRSKDSDVADNAAHYQAVSVDGTNYGYNLSPSEKPRLRKAPKYVESYGHHHQQQQQQQQQQQLPPPPAVFHMQTPHGFKKSDEAPSTAQQPVYEDVTEEVLKDGEPEWRAYETQQARNDRHFNNYRHVFDSHFGKLRPPNSSSQGAYSYMNFEGESRNAYELQHNLQRNRLKL